MKRSVTFMGVTTTVDMIADRTASQRKAEQGLITPKGYWASLRASFNDMTDDEKRSELIGLA